MSRREEVVLCRLRIGCTHGFLVNRRDPPVWADCDEGLTFEHFYCPVADTARLRDAVVFMHISDRCWRTKELLSNNYSSSSQDAIRYRTFRSMVSTCLLIKGGLLYSSIGLYCLLPIGTVTFYLSG